MTYAIKKPTRLILIPGATDGNESKPRASWMMPLANKIRHEFGTESPGFQWPIYKETFGVTNWLTFLSRQIESNADSAIVTHCIGGYGALELIKTNRIVPPHMLVLVAPPSAENLNDNPKLKELAEKAVETKTRIVSTDGKIFIYCSENDPLSSLAQSRKLGERLGAEVIVIDNAGHFDNDENRLMIAEKIYQLLGFTKSS